ncbi:MAG TPA: hypothetical protein V6C76_03995 [Drouetiella sp.]
MVTLLSNLVSAFSGIASMSEPEFESTNHINGSLQEQLMAVNKPQTFEGKTSHNELSVGPPPLTEQYGAQNANVVTLPKRQGSRVIYWSKINQTNQVA